MVGSLSSNVGGRGQGSRWKKPLYNPHPLYGYVLRRLNEATPWLTKKIGQQTIGRDGFRVIPEQGATRLPKLTFYGCSFTFGLGISDSESFPALLQRQFPTLRISNKGVSGYSNVQMLLHFRSDLRKRAVDYAVLGFNSRHIMRNILAHPFWLGHPFGLVSNQTERLRKIGVEQMPRAQMTRDGTLRIEFVSVDQLALASRDIDAFLPDDYMIDSLTIALLKHFLETGRAAGVPVLIALLDQREPEFNARILAEIPEAVDISLPIKKKYVLLSQNTHPNALANSIFAERLAPQVTQFTGVDAAAKAG